MLIGVSACFCSTLCSPGCVDGGGNGGGGVGADEGGDPGVPWGSAAVVPVGPSPLLLFLNREPRFEVVSSTSLENVAGSRALGMAEMGGRVGGGEGGDPGAP
jgi:hypothetical protein